MAVLGLPDLNLLEQGGKFCQYIKYGCELAGLPVGPARRPLLPLDEDTLVASVRKTTKAVIVHEAPTRGGFGAEIAAVLAEKALDCLDAPILRVGAQRESLINSIIRIGPTA